MDREAQDWRQHSRRHHHGHSGGGPVPGRRLWLFFQGWTRPPVSRSRRPLLPIRVWSCRQLRPFARQPHEYAL